MLYLLLTCFTCSNLGAVDAPLSAEDMQLLNDISLDGNVRTHFCWDPTAVP